MRVISQTQGNSPVILAFPHSGTWLPNEIFEKLNSAGQQLSDTDWHVDKLYQGLLDNVTTVKANFHRYVVDANRSPDDQSLYPGQQTTGLVPLIDFNGTGIWLKQPTETDVKQRVQSFHLPYHTALKQQIKRVKDIHGFAILYDCHSICSVLPFLFDGQLPEINIGTFHSQSCAPQIEQAVVNITKNSAYRDVCNGRFVGGWTTRHYGNPAQNVHSIQMELAQSTYLAEEGAPWNVSPTKAGYLRVTLQQILQQLNNISFNTPSV